MTKARGIALVPLLAAGLMAIACAAAVSQAGAAKAGPATAKCGKLGQKAAKQRCLKQNKANRIAFSQIKNSRFVGTRGDGEEVDSVYCANGKYESRTTDSYGTGVSTGRSWRIKDAVVRRGGKWIDAFLEGADGFEIALQRRGQAWKYGVASLGRILYPGDVAKTGASAECAALQV